MMTTTNTPNSSNIKSISYDDTNATMIVTFNAGGIYEYSSVPKGIYDNFIHAKSVGSFFHEFIKGKFGYKKIK